MKDKDLDILLGNLKPESTMPLGFEARYQKKLHSLLHITNSERKYWRVPILDMKKSMLGLAASFALIALFSSTVLIANMDRTQSDVIAQNPAADMDSLLNESSVPVNSISSMNCIIQIEKTLSENQLQFSLTRQIIDTTVKNASLNGAISATDCDVLKLEISNCVDLSENLARTDDIEVFIYENCKKNE